MAGPSDGAGAGRRVIVKACFLLGLGATVVAARWSPDWLGVRVLFGVPVALGLLCWLLPVLLNLLRARGRVTTIEDLEALVDDIRRGRLAHVDERVARIGAAAVEMASAAFAGAVVGVLLHAVARAG